MLTNMPRDSELESINIHDEPSLPVMTPLTGFTWEFLAEGWALKATVVQSILLKECSTKDAIKPEDSHSPSDVKETPNNSDESDDSISEFERNLRELISDFLGDSESSKAEIPKKYSKK